MLIGTKSLLASRGVWGGLLAVLASIAGLFGYTITPDQQFELLEAAALVASGIGGILAVWGRVSATKRIG